MTDEASRQIVEIVQPPAQIGIVGAVDARASLILHALDGRLRGEAGAHGVGEPLPPALIVGKEAVGLDDFTGFAGEIELGGFQHGIDREPQFPERVLQAQQFGARIVGDHAVDFDARLVQENGADGEAFGESFAVKNRRPGGGKLRLVDFGEIDQRSLGHDFGQHHGDRGERLFFFLVVMACGPVLHGEHAEDALAAYDRHREEGVERIFAGLRPVGEARMLRRVG